MVLHWVTASAMLGNVHYKLCYPLIYEQLFHISYRFKRINEILNLSPGWQKIFVCYASLSVFSGNESWWEHVPPIPTSLVPILSIYYIDKLGG